MVAIRSTESNKRGKHMPTLMVTRGAILESSFLLVSTKRETFELKIFIKYHYLKSTFLLTT